MPSETLVRLARAQHRAVSVALRDAERQRKMRDELIRRVRRDDPLHWSYARIARHVGCSPELVASICRRSL